MKYATHLVLGSIAAAAVLMAGTAYPQGNPPTQPKVRAGLERKAAPSPRPGGLRPDTAVVPQFPHEVRTIDGSGNNPGNPAWGQAGTPLLRFLTEDYADGVVAPSGGERPSAREVSNACAHQEGDVLNSTGATDMLWQWGQFLDHDITLTPLLDPVEPFDIPVPAGDPWFDPTASGEATIPMDRSFYEYVDGVAQQINEITSFIDASMVYGSDEERAKALRTLDGTGQLKMSPGGLLPYNEDGLPNAPSSSAEYFLAGDFRANEQVGLTVMHTLFVREHNKWARFAQRRNPQWDGERIYQYARAMVTAEIQQITYDEFLPVLLGRDALPPYRGYRPEVEPGIMNCFATAAYRVGHTMLSDTLLRLDVRLEAVPEGYLSLADAFFNPENVVTLNLAPYLRGLSWQQAQEVDSYIVDGVRNFLFGPPGAGGFDLASLNIQRGRDHGLPGYNAARRAFGLAPVESFADITSKPEVQERLAAVYASVEHVDLWMGGLCEDHVRGAMVGETFRAILVRQFTALRDGDRFWYQGYLDRRMLRRIERQTLARIIRRNTYIRDEIRNEVFRIR